MPLLVEDLEKWGYTFSGEGTIIKLLAGTVPDLPGKLARPQRDSRPCGTPLTGVRLAFEGAVRLAAWSVNDAASREPSLLVDCSNLDLGDLPNPSRGPFLAG